MEKCESILEAICEEDDLGDGGDVEMLDVEEGELVDGNSVNDRDKSGFADVNGENQGFVLDTCRRLKEKKSYMVYTAVGCLGISALSDLVKEKRQTTVQSSTFEDGNFFFHEAVAASTTAFAASCSLSASITMEATWLLLSTNNSIIIPLKMDWLTPSVARTMNWSSGKQFKQQNVRQAPAQSKEISSQETTLSNGTAASVPQGAGLIPNDPAEEFSAEGARKSVHDRIRVPVSYEDLLGEDSKDD
ncbi:hypothetical protein GOBAR_DD16139 [Gossypium barbadense]|nr:hypothetical protein GOBAR_DD16139 [Gossypium barbadense]